MEIFSITNQNEKEAFEEKLERFRPTTFCSYQKLKQNRKKQFQKSISSEMSSL